MTITVKLTHKITRKVEYTYYFIRNEESTGDCMTSAECHAARDYGDMYECEAIDPRK